MEEDRFFIRFFPAGSVLVAKIEIGEMISLTICCIVDLFNKFENVVIEE